LGYWQVKGVLHENEGVDDNGDEQVEEDLRDDDLERNEVDFGCFGHSTAVGLCVVVLDFLVGRLIIALEGDRVSAGCVKHEGVPSFPSRAAHEQQKGLRKVLEIRMLVHVALEFNHGEQLHTDDAVHEL